MLNQKTATPGRGRRWRPALRPWFALAALAAAMLLAALWPARDARRRPATGAAPSSEQRRPAPAAVPPIADRTQPAATLAVSRALTSADEVQRIEPAEAKALLDRGEAVLYDVRSADSFQAKHAAGAMSLPMDQIEAMLSTLPKGKALILYCT